MNNLAFKHVGERQVHLYKGSDTCYGVSVYGDGDGAWFFPTEAEARKWFDAFTEGDDE